MSLTSDININLTSRTNYREPKESTSTATDSVLVDQWIYKFNVLVENAIVDVPELDTEVVYNREYKETCFYVTVKHSINDFDQYLDL